MIEFPIESHLLSAIVEYTPHDGDVTCSASYRQNY